MAVFRPAAQCLSPPYAEIGSYCSHAPACGGAQRAGANSRVAGGTGMRKKRMDLASCFRYSAGMDTNISLINRARAYLDERRGERTTLEELGRAVGASPFHLQRCFKRTLGLSPRDYQQALRLQDTKRALAGGSRVTDAVFNAGYGSLSRFYEKAAADLGMAARAYRAKGKGQAISYTTFASPLGCVLLASTERGLCSVKLGDSPEALVHMLAEEFSEAELKEDRVGMKDTKA